MEIEEIGRKLKAIDDDPERHEEVRALARILKEETKFAVPSKTEREFIGRLFKGVVATYMAAAVCADILTYKQAINALKKYNKDYT